MSELGNYNLYAGLGGSFGGASYFGTVNNVTLEEAADWAFEEAVNIYESYEGYHGIRDVNDIMEEEEVDLEEAEEIYVNEREDWLDYYVIPTDEDNSVEELDILNE